MFEYLVSSKCFYCIWFSYDVNTLMQCFALAQQHLQVLKERLPAPQFQGCVVGCCTLDVVFRQISTFLEDSVAIVYGLRGL